MIEVQVKALKVALEGLGRNLDAVREIATHIEFEASDRDWLKHYLETVDIAIRYLDEKLPVLVDPDTSSDDRLHITAVATLQLQQAIHSSENFEDAPSDMAAARQGRQPSRSGIFAKARDCFEELKKWLAEVASKVASLVAGLLTPKEWTLKGRLAACPFFMSATAEVEIKFGQ